MLCRRNQQKYERLAICLRALPSVFLLLCPGVPATGRAERAPQFKQYLRHSVVLKVAHNWTPSRTAKVMPLRVKWKIHKNGSISDLHVSESNKAPVTAVKRAVEAVTKSAPFAPLPASCADPMDVQVRLETTTALKLTVPEAIKHYGPSARKTLREQCRAAGIAYPPQRLEMIGLKQERQLLLFGGNGQKLIAKYPLVSYSGVLGPKLKEGDLQIPEGIYRITGFQSHNMLALCVNYPNDLDRKNAAADHRTKLGGDILVHGGSHSTGCLVISDDDMEQVFVAAHDVGIKNTALIIAPCDLTRHQPDFSLEKQPTWVPDLYKAIKARLLAYPVPKCN